jgi:hypothetical protein
VRGLGARLERLESRRDDAVGSRPGRRVDVGRVGDRLEEGSEVLEQLGLTREQRSVRISSYIYRAQPAKGERRREASGG